MSFWTRFNANWVSRESINLIVIEVGWTFNVNWFHYREIKTRQSEVTCDIYADFIRILTSKFRTLFICSFESYENYLF